MPFDSESRPSEPAAAFVARALRHLENDGDLAVDNGRVTWMFDSTVHLTMPMDRREIQALLDTKKANEAEDA